MDLHCSQCSKQFLVFRLCAYCYTQATVTQMNTVAVADNNATVNEIFIGLACIINLHKHEVGVRRINLSADGQYLYGINHTAALQ